MWTSGFTTILLFGILPLATSAVPIEASPAALAASSHNIYLASCVPKSRQENSSDRNFTAIAYFRNPIENSTRDDDKKPRADRSAVVSDLSEPWEGVKWRLKVWKDKVFASDINAGAESGVKGSLAGTAKLGDEDYICFKDGETAIRIKDKDRDKDDDNDNSKVNAVRGDCIANYWCAGLNVGNVGD